MNPEKRSMNQINLYNNYFMTTFFAIFNILICKWNEKPNQNREFSVSLPKFRIKSVGFRQMP